MAKLTTPFLMSVLGTSRQSLEEQAQRKCWEYTLIPGHGRGGKVKQWLRESLDPGTLAKVEEYEFRQQLQELAGGTPQDVVERGLADKPQEALDTLGQSVEEARKKAIAWLEILKRHEVFKTTCRLLDKDAKLETIRQLFCRAFDARELGLSDKTHEAVSSISSRSLRRKGKAFDKHGFPGLVDSFNSKLGKTYALTEAQQRFILANVVKSPDIRPARLHELLIAKYGKENVPRKGNVIYFLKRWKAGNLSLHTFMRNPDEWKNKYMPAFGNMSEAATHLNAIWELDSTPADVQCSDGKRWNIIGGIDVYSRMAGLHLSPTSSSEGIATLSRKMFMEMGIPQCIRKDNGQDYASKRVQQICEALRIETPPLPPFTPEAKPHIERFFRTLAHAFFEEMPGYVGHNVVDRQAIRSREAFADRLFKKGATVHLLCTSEELQGWIDRWLKHVYHQRTHSALGMSPVLKAAQSPVKPQKLPDPRAWDILLLERVERTIQKKGIRWENEWYQSLAFATRIGELVDVKQDPEDMARLFVFSKNNKFICEAMERSRAGLKPEDYKKAKAQAKKEIRAKLRAYKELEKDGPTSVSQALVLAAEAKPGKVCPLVQAEAFEAESVVQAEEALAAKAAGEAEYAPPVPELPEGADPDLEGMEITFLPNGELVFLYAYEKYEYLVSKSKQRILTAKEKEFIDGFKETEAYRTFYEGKMEAAV
jgi:putative transposase